MTIDPAPEPTPTAEPAPADPASTPEPIPTAFSQADVDRIVSERIGRERAKFADYSDLKSKAGKLAEIEAASQTELERAVAKARDEARTEATQAGNTRLVSAEVRALAAEAHFRDPRDAIAQLRDSLGEISVNADGSVDTEAISKALGELATAKPYLLNDTKAPSPRPDPGQGARPTTPEAEAEAEYAKYFPPKPTTRK